MNKILKDLVENDDQTLSLTIETKKIKPATIKIKGYKHSMVQIICMAIAYNINIEILNPPIVLDTFVFCKLINEMGGKAMIKNHKLTIDTHHMQYKELSDTLCKKIHGSLYLMPALLIRFGKFKFFEAGGCKIGKNGSRPYKHILETMRLFGAEIKESDKYIEGDIKSFKQLEEIDIIKFSTNSEKLEGPLIGGATKVALMLGFMLNKLKIKNPFINIDVQDLLRLMSMLGKEVVLKESVLIISGKVNNKRNIKFRLTNCISEIISYLSLGVLNNVKIVFKNLCKDLVEKGMNAEINYLRKMNIELSWHKNDLIFQPNEIINACDIVVEPNGILSDHQPFFALMLTKALNCSTIIEKVWDSRFMYVDNLIHFNANLIVNKNILNIYPSKLIKKNGVVLDAKDVRTGAVTLIAAASTKSNIKLLNCEHILRGYNELIKNMKKFGVKLSFKMGEL